MSTSPSPSGRRKAPAIKRTLRWLRRSRTTRGASDRWPVAWTEDEQWERHIARNGEFPTGWLLGEAREPWQGKISPNTSMTRLLLTIPGDPFPFPNLVWVDWRDGEFEISLRRERRDGDTYRASIPELGVPIQSVRCGPDDAPALLNSYLERLLEDRAARDAN